MNFRLGSAALLWAVVVTASAADVTAIADYSTAPHLPLAVAIDKRDSNTIFVAQKAGGFLVLRLAGDEFVRVAHLPKRHFQHQDVTYLKRRENVVFATLGDHFAAGGAKAGLARIDVSDPAKPKVTAVWTSKTTLRGSAHVEVDGATAYLGAMQHGVFVLDLRQSTRIRELTRILPDKDFPLPNPRGPREPASRGLALKGNILFVANDAGGLRAIDIANPRQPREIGRHINPKMGNKPQAYNKVLIVRDRAYVAIDYCGFEVVDIRDPRNMRQISWWNPWQCEQFKNVWFNSPGHTNQMVINGREVWLSAGDSELLSLDVSTPRRPQLAWRHGAPRNGRGTWGLNATDERIYLTYIRTPIPFRGTWAGIIALDVQR
ncbi:MAG: hypothetical protein AAF493_04330 [Pseudomonadota bacterium]